MSDLDLAQARQRVDALLERHLADKRARLAGVDGIGDILDAVEGLTRRGGKRVRPALVLAGHAAVAPIADLAALDRAAAAFELLQTYLLIQDDWMDGDDVRRGGPSAHALLRTRITPAHRADSVAILASDLASADAWALLAEAEFPPDRVRRALQAFAQIHEEVVLGQYLDVVASPDVERIHLWKTAGYTVRGPLMIGAILGGGSAAAEAALDAWARPIGVAFQMRDDLLGTFGDPAVTGKPAGNDLRQGKETVLVARARGRPELWARLGDVLGRVDASDADVAAATAALEAAGVRAEVETELRRRVAEAAAALVGAPLRPEGVRALGALAEALTSRSA